MKSRVIFPLVAVATLFVASSEANAFGLLNRMLGSGCCAAPTCCEATCGAAEATCAAAEPACGCAAAPTCAAEPSCGSAPACDSGCGTTCCRPTPIRDCLANLHCKLKSLKLCHRHCCDSGCGGCASEPACGCAAEPACGCAN